MAISPPNSFKSISIEMEDGTIIELGRSHVAFWSLGTTCVGMCTPYRDSISGPTRSQCRLDLTLLPEAVELIQEAHRSREVPDGWEPLPENWPRQVPIEVDDGQTKLLDD